MAEKFAKLSEALKAYIGFQEEDVANLLELQPLVRPHLDAVAKAFYEAVVQDPQAKAVFVGGQAQITAQHARLERWLEELFTGPFDAVYFEHHSRVGKIHVDVGLPQHYMFVGMETVSCELERIIHDADPPRMREKLRSVSRILALELAVMLEAYKDDYTAHIRLRERAAVEQRLTRAEHLAHIGQLAAALAHAIKNPLAGISGAIQVIRGGLAPGNPHRPIIDEMLGQIDRLDSTVKDLLIYARPKDLAVSSVELNELIAQVLNVLREEPSLRCLRVIHRRNGDLPRIRGDERQLEQVVMNLLLNAADASSEGDKIMIETAFDETVRMRIDDHGVGMDEAALDRVFEPFFTTKTKGTGLGLSICRQIVEAHGGSIHVQSRSHYGTTVTVALPTDPRPSSQSLPSEHS